MEIKAQAFEFMKKRVGSGDTKVSSPVQAMPFTNQKHTGLLFFAGFLSHSILTGNCKAYRCRI